MAWRLGLYNYRLVWLRRSYAGQFDLFRGLLCKCQNPVVWKETFLLIILHFSRIFHWTGKPEAIFKGWFEFCALPVPSTTWSSFCYTVSWQWFDVGFGAVLTRIVGYKHEWVEQPWLCNRQGDQLPICNVNQWTWLAGAGWGTRFTYLLS